MHAVWGGEGMRGKKCSETKICVSIAVVITHNSSSYHDNICHSVWLCLTSVNQSMWHVKTVLINKDMCLHKRKTKYCKLIWFQANNFLKKRIPVCGLIVVIKPTTLLTCQVLKICWYSVGHT